MNDKSIILSELNQFELNLSQFNSNDLLVNIQVKHVLPFEKETEELRPESSKLINAAHQKEREEGIFPLCLSEGILFLKQPACEQQIPIFLHLLNPKINPVLNQVSWNITADEWIINPYLLHVLSFEETEFTSLEKKELCDLLSSKGYDVEPSLRYIGNFHPYRHSLLKEVIELKKESDLSHFDFLYQGAQRVEEPTHKSLAPLLFEADHTQYQAIKRAELQHLVIQGPPGTGKSQVIGNLIGQFLAEKLTEAHGQPTIIESKAGGGGSVAIEMVAKSVPDGYTLLVTSPTLTISPIINSKFKINPLVIPGPVKSFIFNPQIFKILIQSLQYIADT